MSYFLRSEHLKFILMKNCYFLRKPQTIGQTMNKLLTKLCFCWQDSVGFLKTKISIHKLKIPEFLLKLFFTQMQNRAQLSQQTKRNRAQINNSKIWSSSMLNMKLSMMEQFLKLQKKTLINYMDFGGKKMACQISLKIKLIFKKLRVRNKCL